MSPSVPTPPIRNMRIRFWGVQGSCPMFPEPQEVEQYKWAVANDAITRLIVDMQARHAGGPVSVAELLGASAAAAAAAPDDPTAIIDYQRTLGATDFPVYGGETTCVIIET